MIEQFVNKMLVLGGRRAVSTQRQAISAALVRWRVLSDDELRARCAELLDGALPVDTRAPVLGPFERLARYLRGVVFRSQRTREDAFTLSLAVECFSRVPADLPPESRLYPEQIDAAWALSQGSLVEMETGEGKTYGLLPAAFLLACTHYRVYVLCASAYLAWRDARRTRPFWEFVGVAPAFCDEESEADEWSRRVVYTTLRALVFKALRDEAGAHEPGHPLTFSAVILDEVDAILLDQATGPHNRVVAVEASAFDWSFALTYARALTEGRDIRVDRLALTAALTVEGTSALHERLLADGAGASRLLLTRYAVELAYVASRVAEERVDFVVEGERLLSVDRISGRVEHYHTPDWIIPLAVERGLSPPPKTISVHRLLPITVLNRFAHVSGTSGTIVGEALEYAANYGLYAMRIDPRFPRHAQDETEQVFGGRAAAIKRACGKTLEILAMRRPVLIGTQSIADAEEIFHQLRAKVPEPVAVHLLTGVNEEEAATVFEAAGGVDTVVVATQLAGRGIDIRLTDEARRNGGMALICVGHGLEPRHDRQFMGRVGRHGDPFTVTWISSLDDPLLTSVGATRISRLMDQLGMDEDEPIEHKLVFRALRTAQRRLKYRRFLSRTYMVLESVIDEKIAGSIRSWLEYLQLPGAGATELLSDDFIDRLVQHFVVHGLATQLREAEFVDATAAQRAVATIDAALDLGGNGPVGARDLEGLSAEDALAVVRDLLGRALRTRLRQWERTALRLERDGVRLGALARACHELGPPLKSIATPSPQDTDGSEPAREFEAGETLDQFALVLGPAGELDDDTIRAHEASVIEAALRVVEDTEPPAESLEAHVVGLLAQLAGGATPLVIPDETRKLLAASAPALTDAARAARRRAWLYETRSPRATAHWCLRLGWMAFLDERERMAHRAWRQGAPELEVVRMLSQRTDEEWRKREADLSRPVLQYLLRADQPEELNEVFYFVDHQATPVPASASPYRWEATRTREARGIDLELRAIALVDQFVALRERDLAGHQLETSKLRRLLADFTRANPLFGLQTPQGIQRALEAWVTKDVEDGVSSDRRKFNRKWLDEFLRFLREQRIVGPLPTRTDKVRSRLRRFVESLREPGSAAVAIALLGFAGLFAVVAVWGNVLPAKPLTGLRWFIDTVLLANMVSRGNLLAPAVGPVVVGMALRYLMARPGATIVSGDGWDRIVVPVLQLAVAAWMVWGSGGAALGWLGTVLGLGWFVLAIVLATITRWVVWGVQNRLGLDLTGAWVCWTVGLAVWSHSGSSPEPHLLALAFASVAVLTVVADALNLAEVEVVSTHVRSAQQVAESEDLETVWQVPGQAGMASHVFAFVLTWFVFEHLGLARVFERLGPLSVEVSALAIYYLVVVGWSRSILRQRTAPDAWAERLNALRLFVRDAQALPELRERLHALRRSLWLRDAAIHLVLIAAAAAWLTGARLPGSTTPLTLAAVAGGSVFALALKTFWRQLSPILFRRAIPGAKTVDFALPPEHEEPQTLWDRVAHAVHSRLALMLTILIVLVKAVELLLDLLKLWPW